MAAVTLTFPALLSGLIGTKKLALNAATPEDALEKAIAAYPALRFLLFDEAGELREHVLCFHNEDSTRWKEDGLHCPLQPHDRLTILQAVAGG